MADPRRWLARILQAFRRPAPSAAPDQVRDEDEPDVEAVARTLYRRMRPKDRWLREPPETRQMYRDMARATIPIVREDDRG